MLLKSVVSFHLFKHISNTCHHVTRHQLSSQFRVIWVSVVFSLTSVVLHPSQSHPRNKHIPTLRSSCGVSPPGPANPAANAAHAAHEVGLQGGRLKLLKLRDGGVQATRYKKWVCLMSYTAIPAIHSYTLIVHDFIWFHIWHSYGTLMSMACFAVILFVEMTRRDLHQMVGEIMIPEKSTGAMKRPSLRETMRNPNLCE